MREVLPSRAPRVVVILAAPKRLFPSLYHEMVVVLAGLLRKNTGTLPALLGTLEMISTTAGGPDCMVGRAKRGVVKGCSH